jgi:NAD(P)-dependent dehydrogenase (short-subunit alcohol dehydrogenase family)
MTEGRLAGKTALISGGAGGVGRAAALLFAAAGAQVALADIQAEAGAATAAEIEAAGGQALFVQADVSQRPQVQAAVEQVLARFERIDILFNHAGTVIVKPFLETTEAEWDWLMSINVKSMFHMCQAVLPGMLAAGSGAIVNTSSISGLTASPLESLYCTTKGAVLQLTRALAVEYRERGIRCNAVCPGFIRTDHGLREMQAFAELGLDVQADIAARQVRICEPEEVARAALFLASDEASFLNGAALVVDNGWTALT